MDQAAAAAIQQVGVMNPVLDAVADLNWPGLATAYWGYRGLRYAHRRTNQYLADNRREHQLDNFYNTRRPDQKYLSHNQMTFIGPRRQRRTFVRAPRQSGYVPQSRRTYQGSSPGYQGAYTAVPRSLPQPKDVIYLNVINMKDFTADGQGSISGVLKPADILNCPKMARFVNSYQWFKLHSMSVEWIGSHPSFIMSCYDSDSTEVQTQEPHFERQGSLRLHRSDRNGRNGVLSRTQSLQMKPGFQDYMATSDIQTNVNLASNACSIKFLAPNTYLSYSSGTSDQKPPKMSAIFKFKVSFYGIKEVLPGNQDTNSQITVMAE